MKHYKPKPSLKETIDSNRAALSAMAKLAGKEPPVFSEMSTDKPKKTRKKNPNAVLTVSEHDIQKTIIAYLKAHPSVCWVARFNSGIMVEEGRYTAFNSLKGCPDIMGMKKGGTHFSIEVKSKTGKPTQAQDDHLCQVLKGGGLAGIARSIEDVDRILGFS
jgi:hypothetical protein